jgi:hypothetical protein
MYSRIILPTSVAGVQVPTTPISVTAPPEIICTIIMNNNIAACVLSLGEQGRINEDGLVRLTDEERDIVWPSEAEEPIVSVGILRTMIEESVNVKPNS